MKSLNKLLKYWRSPTNFPQARATTSAEAIKPKTPLPKQRQSTRSASTTSETWRTPKSEQSTYFPLNQGNLKPQRQHPKDARRDNRPLRQGLINQAETKPKETKTKRRREDPLPDQRQDQPNHKQLRLLGKHRLEKIPNARPILYLQRQRTQVSRILKQTLLLETVHQHQVQGYQLLRYQELVHGL